MQLRLLAFGFLFGVAFPVRAQNFAPLIKCRVVETPLGNEKQRVISNEEYLVSRTETPIALKSLHDLKLGIMNTTGAIDQKKVPQITVTVEDTRSGVRSSAIDLLSSDKPLENGNLSVIFVRKNKDALGVVCALADSVKK